MILWEAQHLMTMPLALTILGLALGAFVWYVWTTRRR